MNEEIDLNPQPADEQPVLPCDPPLEERPAAEPSEVETLRETNASLDARIRQLEARGDVTSALRSAGARSPELLFEAVKNSLQFGDDGSVENAEAVVAEMKRKYPEQFGPAALPSIDAGAGRNASPAALTKEALSKMKPDEIARLDWAVIREALAN